MKLFHNWCIYDQAFLGHIWCVFSCFNMCSVQIYSAIKQLLYMKSLYESHLWCHSSGITDSDHHYFCVHPWSLSEEDVRKVGECLGILRLGFATCPEQMPSSEPWEKKQKSPRDLDANLPHAGECRNFGTRAVFRHIYLDLYLSLELCWSDRSHTLQSCWCPCWCGFQSLQRDPLLQIRRDTPEQAQGRDRYAAENEEKREDFFFLLPWKMKFHWVHHLSSAEGLWQGVWAVWDWQWLEMAKISPFACSDHLGEASNSSILTHHLWDTVCASWINVLWEMQIRKRRSCSVLLSLSPLDLAAVMSILAALMLWSTGVDPPPAVPSMCMENRVSPLTYLCSNHLDGCNKTQQGWRGCALGMGSRQSSPGFVSTEAGRSPGKNPASQHPFLQHFPMSLALIHGKRLPESPCIWSLLRTSWCNMYPALCREGGNPGSSELTGKT